MATVQLGSSVVRIQVQSRSAVVVELPVCFLRFCLSAHPCRLLLAPHEPHPHGLVM